MRSKLEYESDLQGCSEDRVALSIDCRNNQAAFGDRDERPIER
jgi:hypothetical protein